MISARSVIRPESIAEEMNTSWQSTTLGSTSDSPVVLWRRHGNVRIQVVWVVSERIDSISVSRVGAFHGVTLLRLISPGCLEKSCKASRFGLCAPCYFSDLCCPVKEHSMFKCIFEWITWSNSMLCQAMQRTTFSQEASIYTAGQWREVEMPLELQLKRWLRKRRKFRWIPGFFFWGFP
jgi:hypothetical protein